MPVYSGKLGKVYWNAVEIPHVRTFQDDDGFDELKYGSSKTIDDNGDAIYGREKGRSDRTGNVSLYKNSLTVLDTLGITKGAVGTLLMKETALDSGVSLRVMITARTKQINIETGEIVSTQFNWGQTVPSGV